MDNAVLDLLLTARYVGGPAFARMRGDMEGLVATTDGLSRMGTAFKAVGDTMLVAGVAMAAGVGEAVKQAIAYDDAINRIVAVTPGHLQGITDTTGALDAHTASLIKAKDQLHALRAEMADAAVQWGQQPQAIATGTYYLTSSLGALYGDKAGTTGVNDLLKNNIVGLLSQYSRASGPESAGGVSYEQAAQDLPRLFSAFNMPMQDWGGGMGMLTWLENNAHLTQSQLVQSMTKFTPVASALGMGFNDSSILMAALASSGVTGSRAGTEAGSGLYHMFGGTKSSMAGLKALGLDPNQLFDKQGNILSPEMWLPDIAGQLAKMKPVDRLNAEHNLLGIVGGRGLGGTLNSGIQRYEDLYSGAKTAGVLGSTKQSEQYLNMIALAQMNSPKAQFESLAAAVKLFGIAVGEAALPYVMQFVTWLRNALVSATGFINKLHDEGLTKFVSDLQKTHPLLAGIITFLERIGKAIETAFSGKGGGLGGFLGSMLHPAGGSGLGAALALGPLGLIAGGLGLHGLGAGMMLAGPHLLGGAGGGMMGALGGALFGQGPLAKESEKAASDLAGWKNKTAALNQDFERTVQADFQRKHDALSRAGTAFVQQHHSWENKVASGNQEFERAVKADFDHKSRAYETAAQKYVADRQAIETKLQSTLNKLQDEAKGEFKTVGSQPRDTATGQLLPFSSSQKKDLAFNKMVEANYKEAHGAALGQFDKDLKALGSAPDKAAFLTPFDGRAGAMPLKPQWPKSEDFLTPFEGHVGAMPLKPGEAKGAEGLLGKLFGFGAGKGKGLQDAFGGAVSSHGGVLNLMSDAGAAGRGGVLKGLGALDGVAKDFPGFLKSVDTGIGNLVKGGLGGLGGALKNLATGGFGLLKGAITGFLPALGGIATVGLPLIAIVLAIAGAVTILVLIFTRYRAQAMQVAQMVGGVLGPVFHQIGTAIVQIAGQIGKSWQQMWPQINTAMKGFMQALLQAKPVVEVFGAVIKIVFTVVASVVAGLIQAFIQILPSVINVFTGIVHVITNVAQIVQDIFTGQWGKIPGLIGSLFGSILGILGNAGGAILGFIGGLVGNIIHWFTHLWDQLVGHSIIPDMVNGILQWLGQLPGKGLQLITTLVTNMLGAVASLPQKFADLGGQVISSLANAIINGLGQVMGAVGRIKDNIVNGLKNITLPGGIHLPGFASGGLVGASGLYMVGERGPELMALPGGAHITNHSDTMTLLQNVMLGFGGRGGSGRVSDLHVDNLHLPDGAFPQQQQSQQKPIAPEYQLMHQIQAQREANTGGYDRRSGFDNGYRYGYQWSR